MEDPTPTPRSRILGHSTMVRFFRSLVGSKGSLKSCDKAVARGQAHPLHDQDALSLMISHQAGVGRREWGPPAGQPWALSVAMPRGSTHLPRHHSSGHGRGDMGVSTPSSKEVLKVMAQGAEVKPVLPTESQKELGNLSEKKEEEEEPAGEASGVPGAPGRIRAHFTQAPVVEQEHPQSATRSPPPEVQPEAFHKEEEEKCLLDGGDLMLDSSKVEAAPWNHLLCLYKQLQKSVMAKALLRRLACPQLLKEGLPHEEEEGADQEIEEDSSFKLCVPGIVTLQSPLLKTFGSTETVGFVESELKKLLTVQRESHLWKMSSQEGQELLTQPEITLEEVSIVADQNVLLEEMDKMGN
uniref:Gametogenetin-binding protein 1 n=1 Tax=Otolemur garnettii TaxID=30611 RepID=H0XDK4_OTOGA